MQNMNMYTYSTLKYITLYSFINNNNFTILKFILYNYVNI